MKGSVLAMAELKKQAQVKKEKTERFLNEFKGMTEEKAKAHIKDTYINTQIVYELICAYVFYFDKDNYNWINEFYKVSKPRRIKKEFYDTDGTPITAIGKDGKEYNKYELVETTQMINSKSISNLRKEFLSRYNIEPKQGSFRTNTAKEDYDPFKALFG